MLVGISFFSGSAIWSKYFRRLQFLSFRGPKPTSERKKNNVTHSPHFCVSFVISDEKGSVSPGQRKIKSIHSELIKKNKMPSKTIFQASMFNGKRVCAKDSAFFSLPFTWIFFRLSLVLDYD